jgi:hypothetical protein
MQGDSSGGKNRSALIGRCSAIGLKVGRTGRLATAEHNRVFEIAAGQSKLTLHGDKL